MPGEFVEAVRRGIEEALSLEVRVGDPIEIELDPAAATSSGALVDRLIRDTRPDDDRWYLGLTTADLDAPGRRWVYGEATQGGRWALVSVARFGAPESPGPRMRERTIKEALHELGHLARLDHCGSPGCVMATSGSVPAVDSKNSKFCSRCLARLGELART